MRWALTFIVAVLVWALVFRLMVLPFAYDRTLTGDPASYVNIATNILAGEGMARDNSAIIGGALRAYYPPLYPLLLAVAGLVAPLLPLTFLTINFLIDLASAAALFWLARIVGLSPRAGLVSASAYLLWPTNIIMAPVANKEGLATLFAILMFAFLIRRKMVGFGVFSGLMTLTQPALAVLPVIAGCIFHWRGGWLRSMAAAAAIAALVMMPWWIRNYVLLGKFIPFTTSSGMTFWVGTFGNGVAYLPEVERFTPGHEVGISGRAARDAIGWIMAHPLDYLTHTAEKIPAMLNGDRWGAKPLAWFPPQPWRVEPTFTFLPWFVSVILFVAAAAGAFFARHHLATRIGAACLIQLFAVQLWFQFSERHRYFLVPFLILLAGAGITRLFAYRRARSLATA